jgi:hypothetical protein
MHVLPLCQRLAILLKYEKVVETGIIRPSLLSFSRSIIHSGTLFSLRFNFTTLVDENFHDARSHPTRSFFLDS